VEIYPSYNKGGRWSEWRGQIFDRKLLHSRFCACTVKICLKFSKPSDGDKFFDESQKMFGPKGEGRKNVPYKIVTIIYKST